MRLKKIPKGTKYIKFTNNSPDNVIIYYKKEPFLFLGSNSFILIECSSFICKIPVKEFPEMQLYSGKRVYMEFSK